MIDVSSTPIRSPSAIIPPSSSITEKNSRVTRILQIVLPIIVSLIGFVFLSFEIAITFSAVVTAGVVFYSGECARQSPNSPKPNATVEPAGSPKTENLRPVQKDKKTPFVTQSHKKKFRVSPFIPASSCLNMEAPFNSTILMTPRIATLKSRSSFTSAGKWLVDPLQTPHGSVSKLPKTGNCLDDAELGEDSVKIVFASSEEKSSYDRRIKLMIKRGFIEQDWIDSTTVVLTLTMTMGFIGVTPKHVVNALKNPSLCLESQHPGFSLIDYSQEKRVSDQPNLDDPLDDAFVYADCVNIQFRTAEEAKRYEDRIDYIIQLGIVDSTTENDSSITLRIKNTEGAWGEYLVLKALREPNFCGLMNSWSYKVMQEGHDANTDDMAAEMSRIIREKLIVSGPFF